MYIGQFRNNLPHGKGRMLWPDGEAYEGDFFAGERSGYGEWRHPGGDIYKGQFKKNVFEGEGSYEYPDGRKHTGKYNKGIKSGQGMFSWPDGRIYKGNFSENEFHGYGEMTLLGGLRYVGQFRLGKRNGKGKLYSSAGEVLEIGVWNDDIIVSPEEMPPRTLRSANTDINVSSTIRVALLIGNTRYQNAARLENPKNDVDLISSSFRKAGFSTVLVKQDLGVDQFNRALQEFAPIADTADVAVIYYAGHAIEFGGVNYLIPVDAKLKSDRDISLQTVEAPKLIIAMSGSKKLKMLILDACRDNPFATQMARTMESRSMGRGLARMEADKGEMIVYAARAGEVADDGQGKNSPFAEAFARRLQQNPPIEIRRLFDFVRDDVLASTNRKQQPFTYGSLPASEDFFFTR